MGIYFAVAAIAYLIGSINFSVIISKKMAGFDLREKGSKNAGTTNTLRTVGKRAALIVLFCDILKGVIAIVMAKLLSSNANSAISCQIAAFCAVFGHTFPIFFEFKGGKGVATSIGVLLVLNWKIWSYYETNKELSEVYNDLWIQLDQWCINNLTGDALKYYYSTTD